MDFTRNDNPIMLKTLGIKGKGSFDAAPVSDLHPDTRWGKESGNRIISMFYDRYRNFVPYTFHVLIEWKLDSSPEKWLITGICVTAVKKYNR